MKQQFFQVHEYYDSHNPQNCEVNQLSKEELLLIYKKMIVDEAFIRQEVNRFQSLLQTAGRNYGGDKYEENVNIDSDNASSLFFLPFIREIYGMQKKAITTVPKREKLLKKIPFQLRLSIRGHCHFQRKYLQMERAFPHQKFNPV